MNGIKWFRFDGYKNLEYSKLSMGRLIGDLSASLEEKMKDPLEKESKLRLAVYACHDTSLGGILYVLSSNFLFLIVAYFFQNFRNALQAFDGRWPPFTSNISFELFRPTPPPASFLSSFLPSFLSSKPKFSDHYVRIRYNSKNLKIPACSAIGNHLEGSNGELCTWDAFRTAVRRVEITGKDWEKGCAV